VDWVRNMISKYKICKIQEKKSRAWWVNSIDYTSAILMLKSSYLKGTEFLPQTQKV